MGTWKRVGHFVKTLVILASMASGAAHAVAMQQQQQQQDTAPAQSSGIVTPEMASGFVKADEWTHFTGGGIAIGWCAKQAFVGCEDHRFLSPQDAVKKLVGPNVRYTGFQLFILKDSTQLYLYYK